jgi:DNA-binding MarR family transcriptional regulator
LSTTKEPRVPGSGDPPEARDATVDRINAAHERLMSLLTSIHTSDFLEIHVTMSQAKVLYLVASVGEMHMSTLPALLGVSLSTVSGTVDRLVDHGLLDRREDPADRRQVVLRPTDAGVAAIDRFRDLNARQLRELLDRIDSPGLAEIEHSYGLLVEAAASLAGGAGDASQPAPYRKGTL